MAGNASVWFQGKKRGPWKVRWRDGTKNAAGKVIKHASKPFVDTASRDVFMETKRAELAAKLAREGTARGGRLATSTVVDRFITHHKGLGTLGAAYAIEFKSRVGGLAEEREWTFLDQITSDAVELWRNDVAFVDVEKPTRMIKRLLRWSSGPPLRARIDHEVLTLAKPARPERPQAPLLTDNDVAMLIERAEELGKPLGLAVEHLARYGCRPNELCRLVVGDWEPSTRTLTHRKTKNRKPISHEVDREFAARLTELAVDRPRTAPLYLNIKGKAWRKNDQERYQEISDWYKASVSKRVVTAQKRIRAKVEAEGGDPSSVHVLSTDQLGIYCLKDYAITRMEALGIDDRTKSTFTAITTLSIYARYKATNRQKNTVASDQIATAWAGGTSGGTLPLRGHIRGQTARQPPKRPARKDRKTPRKPPNRIQARTG